MEAETPEGRGRQASFVKAVQPGSAAAQMSWIVDGLALSAIDGRSVSTTEYDKVIAKLKASGRPVTLHFERSDK